MTPADREQHKRVVLARIALERAELAIELDRLREEARLARVLKALAAAALLRSATSGSLGARGWLGLLRRPALASTVLGLAASLLRRSASAARWLPVAAAAFGLLAALRGARRAAMRRPAPPSSR